MLSEQPALAALGLAVGLYLFLKGLGDQTLRLDEARTALAVEAKRPIPWVPEDRRCLYDAGNLDKTGLPLLHTWGQFYLARAGLGLACRTGIAWGASHPAGWLRFPFALCGWGAVWVSAELAQDILGGQAGLLTLALGLTSTGILLHARQCRYYGPSMLAAALFLLGAFRGHAAGHPAWWLVAGLALAGSYYFDWVASYGLALAAAPMALAYLEPGLGAALALAGFLALPWMLFLKRRIGRLSSVAAVKNLRAGRLKFREIAVLGAHTLWTYLFKLETYVAPTLTLAIAAAVAAAAAPEALPGSGSSTAPGAFPPAFGYALAFLALAVLGIAATRSATRTLFTRYVSAAFPLTVVLGGLGLEIVGRASPAVAGALLALAALTNVAGLSWHLALRGLMALGLPARLLAFVKGPLWLYTAGLDPATFARRAARPAFTLPLYLAGIHRRYPTRTETIARFLREASFPGPVVADTQEAPGLAFHSGAPVVPAGGPSAQARLESASAVVGGGLFAPDARSEFAACLDKGRFGRRIVLAQASDRYLDNAETPERYRPAWRSWPSGVGLYVDGPRGETE